MQTTLTTSLLRFANIRKLLALNSVVNVFVITLENMRLSKKLNDAQLIAMSILRKSRCRTKWPPFHDLSMEPSIAYVKTTKFTIFLKKIEHYENINISIN